MAGMSRSVTVTTAYIMTVTNLEWRSALNAVRGARRTANPNFGFQRQLLAFYHDHLHAEKARFLSCFPPSPFPDQVECERLIEVHRHWVLHGDEGSKDETTYPLAHNAYQGTCAASLAASKPDTVAEVQPSHCNVCERVLPNVISVNCGSGEMLCDDCRRNEQETLNLISQAPDVHNSETDVVDYGAHCSWAAHVPHSNHSSFLSRLTEATQYMPDSCDFLFDADHVSRCPPPSCSAMSQSPLPSRAACSSYDYDASANQGTSCFSNSHVEPLVSGFSDLSVANGHEEGMDTQVLRQEAQAVVDELFAGAHGPSSFLETEPAVVARDLFRVVPTIDGTKSKSGSSKM